MNYKLNLTNGILTRNVNSQRHYFIKFKAYAFDESELLKYKGQWSVLEIRTTTGKTYSISENDFYLNSIINEDFGKVQRLIGVRFLKLESNVQTMVKLPNEFHSRLKATSKKTNKPMNQLLEDSFNSNYGKVL
jgi:hypothetical protein